MKRKWEDEREVLSLISLDDDGDGRFESSKSGETRSEKENEGFQWKRVTKVDERGTHTF